jgi:hypothetical protein
VPATGRSGPHDLPSTALARDVARLTLEADRPARVTGRRRRECEFGRARPG